MNSSMHCSMRPSACGGVALIAAFSSPALLGFMSFIVLLTTVRSVSVGFGSGEFPSQSNAVTPRLLMLLLSPLAVCAGATLSWKKAVNRALEVPN